MKKILLILLTITTFSVFSLDQYIGFTPTEVIETFGAPEYIYTERGAREEEDDIIFFYNNRVYVYFNQNRVWQLRVDVNFKLDVLNIKIGDSKTRVKEVLGDSYKEYDNSTLFRRPDAGYPLYLRVYYVNDKVNDIYLFRGDY